MEILIVTRDKSQKIPKELNELGNLKVVWKNKLSKEDFKNKEMIITLGGDGTFLSASHFLENQIILGINDNPTRSEGYLTTTNLKNLKKKIRDIKEKRIKIKEYSRENIKLFKKKYCTVTERALNETYFGNSNPHHPSNYELSYRNKKEFQRSSGILISTGTGSTAWYKAMGGRKYRKTKSQLRFRIRELFIGRLFKSRIRKGRINPHEKLTIISKINHGILAIDSIRIYKISEEDKIEISVGKPLRVVQ
jgi:hypothetical protein